MAKLTVELDPQDIHDEINSDPEFLLSFWRFALNDPIKGHLDGHFLRKRLHRREIECLVDALDEFKKELLGDD